MDEKILVSERKSPIQCEIYGCQHKTASFSIGYNKQPMSWLNVCKGDLELIVRQGAAFLGLEFEKTEDQKSAEYQAKVRKENIKMDLLQSFNEKLTVTRDILADIAAKYGIAVEETDSKNVIFGKLMGEIKK